MNKKTLKRKTSIIAALLGTLVLLASIFIVAGLTGCSNVPKEANGKWAIVYRCTDNDGNTVNLFKQDEFIEITKNKFIFYRGIGDDCTVIYDTKISYHINTGENNKKLSQLCQYSSCTFSLAEFSDADLGFYFYSSNCMAIGKSSTVIYAILVRCDEIGKPYEMSADVDGVWKSATSSNSKLEISSNVINEKTYRKNTDNGVVIFYGDWEDSHYNKVNRMLNNIAILFSSSDYIAVMKQWVTEYSDYRTETEIQLSVYLKG